MPVLNEAEIKKEKTGIISSRSAYIIRRINRYPFLQRGRRYPPPHCPLTVFLLVKAAGRSIPGFLFSYLKRIFPDLPYQAACVIMMPS